MRYIRFCLFLFGLTACGGPLRATPRSTPMVLSIAMPPYLRPYTEILHDCASTNQEYVIDIIEISTPTTVSQTADIVFQLGKPHSTGFATVIVEERITVIVNASNPVVTISLERLREIFTGRNHIWADVGGKRQPIQVWAYLTGDDVRSAFEAVIFPGEEITPQALLAPTPQAMLEAISDDPLAIGYIPHMWLEKTGDWDQIRGLDMEPLMLESLSQPVLALSSSEPGGPLRQLLVCMQSAGR